MFTFFRSKGACYDVLVRGSKTKQCR